MDHMAPIASIARAELGITPELVSLPLPRGTPSVEKLAAAAGGTAQKANPHVAVFIRAGAPHDFIKRLTAASAAVVDAATKHTWPRGKRERCHSGNSGTASLPAAASSTCSTSPETASAEASG